MTISLSLTARGLRLVRSTHSRRITLPPPVVAGPQAILVTESHDEIVTEAGARIITETA